MSKQETVVDVDAVRRVNIAPSMNNGCRQTMIALPDIWTLAEGRLRDAETLSAGQRHAGAIYLSGYAVELGLKAKVCRTLNWAAWPDSRSEFGKLACLRTHDLPTLLRTSGVEISIKTDGSLSTAWLVVAEWDPETRYRVPDTDATQSAASEMIEAARLLLEYLKK